MAKKYDTSAIRATSAKMSIYDQAQEQPEPTKPTEAPAPVQTPLPVFEKTAEPSAEVRTTVVLPANLRSKLDLLILQESVQRGKKVTLKELFAEIITDYINKQVR